ncbi:hypothetical protein Tco_1013292 [Tanacetum coccineum]
MDDLNITMEEYIRLEKEKSRKRAIVFDDAFTSEVTHSCEPTVSPFNDNKINFRISFDESGDEDYTVIYDKKSFSYKIIYVDNLKTDSENDNDKVNKPSFPSPEPTVSCIDDLDFFKDFENEFPAIVYNDALTSRSDFLTEPTISPQHIYEFNLKDETSLSKCDEEEQNVLYFNDLFPFNVIYPDDSKSDKDNDDDDKIDIKQSSGEYVINTDVGAYAQGSNNLLETRLRCKEIDEVGEVSTIWKSRSVGVLKPQDGCSTHNLAHKLNLENLPSKISRCLRERMELDLEARLIGETLVLNRSLDPFFEDYIELNDLNVPLELRRDQVDDLMPTIKEGEVVEEFRAKNDARMVSKIFRFPSDRDHDKKICIDCALNLKFSCMIGFEFLHVNFFPILYVNVMSKKFYNSIRKDKLEYKGNNVVGALMNIPIFVGTFSILTDFAVLEDMDAYRDKRMGDVIFGKPFLREVGINPRQFEGMITLYNGNKEVTYQMLRSHPRFKHHNNEQCNKIPPLLKVSKEDMMNGISHSY